MYVCMYVYIEREKETERESERESGARERVYSERYSMGVEVRSKDRHTVTRIATRIAYVYELGH